MFICVRVLIDFFLGCFWLLEIEVKARVSGFDAVEERVLGLGGKYVKEEVQVDYYFNHPGRDFSVSDEALRIRCVGDSVFITYKGPKLDILTKTREEVEVGVADFDKTREILLKLGFVEVSVVEKKRRFFSVGDFSVMFDEVKGLGSFVEVEKQAEDYDPLEVVDFLISLGISEDSFERRSYLGLLLEQ